MITLDNKPVVYRPKAPQIYLDDLLEIEKILKESESFNDLRIRIRMSKDYDDSATADSINDLVDSKHIRHIHLIDIAAYYEHEASISLSVSKDEFRNSLVLRNPSSTLRGKFEELKDVIRPRESSFRHALSQLEFYYISLLTVTITILVSFKLLGLTPGISLILLASSWVLLSAVWLIVGKNYSRIQVIRYSERNPHYLFRIKDDIVSQFIAGLLVAGALALIAIILSITRGS